MSAFKRSLIPGVVLLSAGCFTDSPTPDGGDPSTTSGSVAQSESEPDSTTSRGADESTGFGSTDDDSTGSSSTGSALGSSTAGSGDGPDAESSGTGEIPPGCESDLDCGEGRFCDSQCVPIACGDQRVHADEQCDDGNAEDGDGCDNDCTHTQVVIDVSWHNTCALIEGGRVRCWGEGAYGRLGYGNSESIGDDELPWQAGDVVLPAPLERLHSGDSFTCGLTGTEVFCWGDASVGAIGSGDIADLGDDELLVALAPVSLGGPTTRLTVGGRHSCASGPSGQLRCWGAGPAIGYGTGLVVGDDESPASAGTVSIGAAVVDVSAGIEATCVVQTDGAIRCWGENEQGQLGLGHTDPIGDDELPSSISALVFAEDAVQVTAGYRHTCARFVGGGVRCWGGNAYGELGRGDEVQLGDDELAVGLSPIALGDVGAATFIAAGDHHTCALFEDGNVKCWGRNSFGQLGNGSFEHVGDDELPAIASAVDLPAPTIQIDAGGNHTCAVLTDYRVFCWGRNGDGQLGLGHNQDVAVPRFVGPVAVLGPREGNGG